MEEEAPFHKKDGNDDPWSSWQPPYAHEEGNTGGRQNKASGTLCKPLDQFSKLLIM